MTLRKTWLMEKASWNEWFQDADIGDYGSPIGKALQTELFLLK